MSMCFASQRAAASSSDWNAPSLLLGSARVGAWGGGGSRQLEELACHQYAAPVGRILKSCATEMWRTCLLRAGDVLLLCSRDKNGAARQRILLKPAR